VLLVGLLNFYARVSDSLWNYCFHISEIIKANSVTLLGDVSIFLRKPFLSDAPSSQAHTTFTVQKSRESLRGLAQFYHTPT